MKKILIVGANFNNKGAQSMLFVTVDELKKRIPDCDIYFATTEILDESNLNFKRLYYSDDAKQIALESKRRVLIILKSIIKDCIKFLLGRRNGLWMQNVVSEIMPEVNLLIDVSGFNLGDKWSDKIHEDFFDNIRLAKKFNIPMFLMPQSFGAFDYSDDRQYLIKEMKELLTYPKVIFAREEQGYNLLKEQIGLDNVVLSTDLVLQNKGITFNNLFKKELQMNVMTLKTNDNVAVIPNKQCFDHGREALVLDVYKQIIEILLKNNKTVYLMRHSKEDLECCKKIRRLFQKTDNVRILENDFSCIEYDEMVSQFDFIVCSRYHGIVHSFKRFVPCIILGWEIKYISLAKLLKQDEFVFDITADVINNDAICDAVEKMILGYKIQRETIKSCVEKIQQDNCFEYISDWSRESC